MPYLLCPSCRRSNWQSDELQATFLTRCAYCGQVFSARIDKSTSVAANSEKPPAGPRKNEPDIIEVNLAIDDQRADEHNSAANASQNRTPPRNRDAQVKVKLFNPPPHGSTNVGIASPANSVDSPADELVEIVSHYAETHPTERIPSAHNCLPPQCGSPAIAQGSALRTLPEAARFFGPGTMLALGPSKLHAPLVYAVPGRVTKPFDASLIELGLPASLSPSGAVDTLPYWPSYREATPAQRAGFLSWLVKGRSDPEIQLGYVFIYFYGLERRIFIDRKDHSPILNELIRLSPIYRHSASFRHYSSSLIWWTAYLGSIEGDVSPAQVNKAISATEHWSEDSLGMCLADFYRREQPITSHLAYILAQRDPRAQSSVIIKRHNSSFRELFHKRYDAAFPTGFELKAAKRDRRIHYRPASPTLSGEAIGGWNLTADISHVTGLPSQFRQIVDIWSTCIEALRGYDRARRSTHQGSQSAAAYEALPKELQTEDHPEFDAWLNLWRDYEVGDRGPVFPISELAKLKSLPETAKLSKKSSLGILASADAMGFGIEPDARITGRTYCWDDPVGLFFCEDAPDEDLAAYQPAAIFLELGLTIAKADGHIDEDELSHIAQHLERRFCLSSNQAKRLECRRHVLLNSDTACSHTAASLKRYLTPDQRQLVGEFLIGIAAVDSEISDRELRTLQQLYRSLALAPESLDSIVRPHNRSQIEGKDAVRKSQFTLDKAAISRTMRETKEVAEILKRAMVDDQESTEEHGSYPADTSHTLTASVSPATPPPRDSAVHAQAAIGCEGLPSRFHPFLTFAISRDAWPHDVLDLAAREQQLMLHGAIEAINEWSYEQYGDELIVDGAQLTINDRIRRTILEKR